jgi:hypothetical protein
MLMLLCWCKRALLACLSGCLLDPASLKGVEWQVLVLLVSHPFTTLLWQSHASTPLLRCCCCYCSEKTLGEFASSVLDGTAEAEYKSAPIPDEPTDGGVHVIVGKNFDSIVKDAEKDVLLEVRYFRCRCIIAATCQ